MEKSEVFFLQSSTNESENELAVRLQRFLHSFELLKFISPKDFVALKAHYGEAKTDGFVRPIFLKKIGELVRKQGGYPFLTETSTLYTGRRSNALEHIILAEEHGFSVAQTGMPIIMADGLLGDEEIEIPIKGELFSAVKIAALLKKIQALVVISHFTGHLLTGFGATLKNLGMGLASRKGKLLQHSTVTPGIKTTRCTGCQACLQWCPAGAISLKEGKAIIDKKRCIGCAECLTVCRFDAIYYNWSESQPVLQQKMVEHAAGVLKLFPGKVIFLNFLLRITKDCDCMAGFQPVAPDIGILISFDPVAIDAAALDLVEKTIGKPLAEIAYRVDSSVQLTHGEKLGIGQTAYELRPI